MPHLNTRDVFVKNNNDFVHTDMYDGQEYIFRPGEKTPVPIDAARHMFGMGNPDKTETLVRLGWAMIFDPSKKTYVEDPAGIRKLANFVFTKAVVHEEIADPDVLGEGVTIV